MSKLLVRCGCLVRPRLCSYLVALAFGLSVVRRKVLSEVKCLPRCRKLFRVARRVASVRRNLRCSRLSPLIRVRLSARKLLSAVLDLVSRLPSVTTVVLLGLVESSVCLLLRCPRCLVRCLTSALSRRTCDRRILDRWCGLVVARPNALYRLR